LKQPVESPRHGAFTLVHNPWLAAGPGNNAITHGWHFDGTTNYNITRGNNVHAYLDVANTNNPASALNVPVVSTTPDPSLTFNFLPDLTQDPSITANRQAAVTNLFYWNNTIHDILYQYGFNEASGNFQTDNLGRGGNGNDYVQAEAQDGGGSNNANFGTPADGARPRMQMYLWGGVPVFTVNTPSVIAGSYFAVESAFSTNNKLSATGPKTGAVVWYNDNGTPTGTHFACNGTTPGSLAGKIALIIRGGGCVGGFIEKAKNAQNNGAIAVIMVNNVPGAPIAMGGTDNTITIPAVMISDVDGATLAAEITNNLNVTLAAAVRIDGDFDNGVIVHEYGHGVSNRLTGGGANAGCLANQEQGGEGWSDYLALMLTTNWATANLNTGAIPRPIGTFALGQPLTARGIRTAPYSTNLATSPQTYTTLNTMAVPHGIGEIWCSAIWDMTWNIIQQEGVINPNIHDATAPGGNSIALRLVLEGMRLQTCRPGFLDGRDAILAADSILYNSRYKCAIWKAFAKRGMGFSASQGSSNNVTDGVAAFDVPSRVTLTKRSQPLTAVQGELVAINITANCECLTNTNYTLRDTIPAGFTYVSSTGGTLVGNVVSFSGLNFPNPQDAKTFTVVITPNNAGCAINKPVNDNREGSTIGGLTSVIATGAINWVTSNTRSASPSISWFAASSAANKDFSLTSPAPGFAAGNLSLFSFKHFYITENTLDGGRVEYTTDNGVTWLDAGPFIIQNAYNNTASAAPWGAGQRMFGGVSFGRGSGQFIHTIVNLSSLSGQTIRVRLRSRSNATNSGTYEGWFVDDILQMDGCGGIVRAGLYNGTNVKTDSMPAPVFIIPGPAVAITAHPGNTTVCDGSTATFTAAANAITNPTYQWQRSTDVGATWADIAGETNTTLNLTGVTVAMSGYLYRLIARSGISSGFVISTPGVLTVNPTPTVNAITSQDVCNNFNTTAVNFSGLLPGTVFNWTNNIPSIGLVASGVGNIAGFRGINPTATAIVATVTVTPTNTIGGLTCTGVPVTFTITVNPTPVKPVVIPELRNSIHSSIVSNSYQWYLNGAVILNSNNQYYTPQVAAYYQVQVTTLPGCANKSDSLLYIPEKFLSAGLDGQFVFIYPKPAANNIINIHLNLPASKPVNYNLYTGLGQLLQNGVIPAGTRTYTIDVKKYPSASYMLKLTDSYKVKKGFVIPVLRGN
jgi:extracellular elastinolytic metalloproteinase